MTPTQCSGSYHCGELKFEIEISGEPGLFSPRTCDCDFCRKHGAAYISGPMGKLTFTVSNEINLNRYQQGDKIADLLICNNCGVLVGVCFQHQGQLYAAVNSNAIEPGIQFGKEIVVSPKHLSGEEKTQRWQNIWVSNVSIKQAKAP